MLSPDPDQLANRLRRRAVIDGQTGCWLWQGACTHEGYGVLALKLAEKQKLLRVNRVAAYCWGSLPLRGKAIVIACPHNRRCFRPEHLSVRRRAGKARFGQANGRAKLTEVEARLILDAFYRECKSPAQLARLVDGKVKESAIEALVKGKTWGHLERRRAA